MQITDAALCERHDEARCGEVVVVLAFRLQRAAALDRAVGEQIREPVVERRDLGIRRLGAAAARGVARPIAARRSCDRTP
jgi:hypothetical protein